jgi:hypothetical protein
MGCEEWFVTLSSSRRRSAELFGMLWRHACLLQNCRQHLLCAPGLIEAGGCSKRAGATSANDDHLRLSQTRGQSTSDSCPVIRQWLNALGSRDLDTGSPQLAGRTQTPSELAGQSIRRKSCTKCLSTVPRNRGRTLPATQTICTDEKIVDLAKSRWIGYDNIDAHPASLRA